MSQACRLNTEKCEGKSLFEVPEMFVLNVFILHKINAGVWMFSYFQIIPCQCFTRKIEHPVKHKQSPIKEKRKRSKRGKKTDRDVNSETGRKNNDRKHKVDHPNAPVALFTPILNLNVTVFCSGYHFLTLYKKYTLHNQSAYVFVFYIFFLMKKANKNTIK